MAYTKAQQQIILHSAVGIVEHEAGGIPQEELRQRLMERFPTRTDTDRITISRIARQAEGAWSLAQRFQERPAYRPRAGTYPSLPIAYSGEEGFEYRVLVRARGVGAGPDAHGLMVVSSERPLSGAEAQTRALEMARALERGDPYFRTLGGRAGGPGVEAIIISAIRMTVS